MRTGLALLLVAALGLVAACAATERAAARDPMKCERDPACTTKNGKIRDCSTQCNDDPACMDRCREMDTEHLGSPPP